MNTSHNTTVAGQRTCFSQSCSTGVRWGISSSVEKKNPDGSPLTLYACDKHEPELTSALRAAKTRYQLFPVTDPDPVGWVRPVQAPEEVVVNETKNRSLLHRIFVSALVVAVGIIIAPFVIGYYGVKWICGWRPRG